METPRIMAIDFGTKYTSIFFNDYTGTKYFKDNEYCQTLVSENYKEHIAFLMNGIRRLKPTLVIYERMLDGVEKIRNRIDKGNLWKIFRTVIGNCQESKIAGIPIAPNELTHYRNSRCFYYNDKTGSCDDPTGKHEGYKYINEFTWIKWKKLDIKIEQLPKDGKKEAEAEGFVGIGEEACNELDAMCLGEYGAYYDHMKDTKWLEFRQNLHGQELDKEVRPVIGRSKIDRRGEDNWSVNGKDNLGEKPVQKDQEEKQDINCSDCSKSFSRPTKYINKTKPNYCYDCVMRRKKGKN